MKSCIQHLRTQSQNGETRLSGKALVRRQTHVESNSPVQRKADFTQAATLDLRFQDEIDKVKMMPFQAKGTA